MPGALWAFDFDGVVCDSVGESSLSAWRAAEAKVGFSSCCNARRLCDRLDKDVMVIRRPSRGQRLNVGVPA